jgi:hypothetical protein
VWPGLTDGLPIGVQVMVHACRQTTDWHEKKSRVAYWRVPERPRVFGNTGTRALRRWAIGVKGGTPLYPRSKGVSPLWTPQNGVESFSQAGVIRTLESGVLPGQ